MPERRKPDFALETALWGAGVRRVAGVDEAGRGPLAGPVVVAAVILPREWPAEIALDDSKRMTPAAREIAFGEIRRRAVAYRIALVSAREIDRINILRATLVGMARAVAGLAGAADWVLVDGNQAPSVAVPCRTVVGGDGRSLSIAAASVLAKVVRDRLMRVYDRRYPGWGFAVHKGYPTAAHRAALARLGPSPIHRRTFAGCAGPEGAGQAGRQAPAGGDGGGVWPVATKWNEAGLDATGLDAIGPETDSGVFPVSGTRRAG
jgi:ribonuclease HII